MRFASIAGCAVFLTVVACGDPTSATQMPAPTLLVTNTTCDSGPCVSFVVSGFVPKFTVPGQPPSGFLYVGIVDSASKCLRFPTSKTLYIIGPNDTTAITWTVTDPVSLTATKSGSALPFAETAEFVPDSSPGWSVDFQSVTGTGVLVRSQACTP